MGTLPLQPPRLGSTLPLGRTHSTQSTTMFRLLRSAPPTSMTSRMSPLPRLPSRLLSMTPLPEVLPPSRLLLPFTSSLPLLLSWPPLLLLLSLPLLPLPMPVCTTPPTPTPSTTSATPDTLATLASPTTLELSATPTLDFPLWRLLPPLLRNKLAVSSNNIFPYKFIQSFCASKFL